MSVFGIGTDICDVRRIEATLARRGDRFAERVLGPAELQVFHARRTRSPARSVRFLATRFSAKEAFSKAAGLGIRTPMRWRDCEVLNLASGAPYIRLHGPLADWCATRGLQALVSVTDESDYAASFVLLQALTQVPGQAQAPGQALGQTPDPSAKDIP